MNGRIHELAQVFAGKSSLDEYKLEELQQLTKTYPYFAPAQFLLLEKLKQIDSPDWQSQANKAILYYHDPLLFDLFISPEKYVNDELTVEQIETVSEPEPEEEIEEEIDEQSVVEAVELDTNHVEDRTEQIDEEVEQVHSAETVVHADGDDAEFSGSSDIDEEQNTTATEVEEEPEAIEDDSQIEEALPAQENSLSTEPVALTEPNKLTITAPQPSDQTLSFEPFHTVDYFASQGIKITADELPKDRLGRQMRSFTEWLKTMKRLPATEVSKSSETAAEKTVENLASHSVEDSTVITEAMAEVWVKQGAREKAIETYNKLSLLNPSKKTYFAAKIENLKQS